MEDQQIRNAFDCLLIDEDIDDNASFLVRVAEDAEKKREEEKIRKMLEAEEATRMKEEEMIAKTKACLEKLREGLKMKIPDSSPKVNGNGESGNYSAADSHQNNNGGQNGQISQNGAATNGIPKKGKGKKSGHRNGNGHVRVNGASQQKPNSSSSSETKEGVDEEVKHITNGDIKWPSDVEIADEKARQEKRLAYKKEKEEKRLAEEKEIEEDNKKFTLKQYEKLLVEKRIALEEMKSSERKVLADKDFESMKLVQKKKQLVEDSLVIKQNAAEELKKKETADKEMKARKSMSIHEFCEGTKAPRKDRGHVGQGNMRPRPVKQGPAARASGFILDDKTFPIIGKVVGKA